MDSLFKILFGFSLGAVAVLGWNYYETAQAFQKGLVPSWAPAAQPLASTNPVTPAPYTPASHQPETPPTKAQDPLPPPTTTPPFSANAPTDDAVDPAVLALSSNPQRWPALVSLTKEFPMPVKDGALQVGEVVLRTGTSVGLLRVQPSGKLLVRSQGQIFAIPASHTDVLEQILPESTGPYRAPVRTVSPQPETPATATPDDRTKNPPSQPPAPKGGSVFGTPLAPTQPTATPQHPGAR